MIQLLYVSLANYPQTDPSNFEILRISEHKNPILDVTGCLLRGPSRFAQVLEGEEDVLDALYNRICADRLHRSIDLQFRRNVAERSFPDWTMAFISAGQDLEQELLQMLSDRERPNVVLSMLEQSISDEDIHL